MPPRRPAPERYNAFISQIDLRDVWIASARIANNVGPKHFEDPSLEIKSSTAHEVTPSGFKALQTYALSIRDGTTAVGEIEVTFAVEYSSKKKLTESLFSVFQELNLPLNTWPYLRAFVGDAFGRMGWVPLTLPAFKAGDS